MTLKQQMAQIAAKLKPKIDDALDNEVAVAVKAVESTVIDEVVYGAYEPVRYDRRRAYGGIGDQDNMEHRVKDGVLEVWNDTPANPGGVFGDTEATTSKYLDKLIEYGHGGPGGFYDFPKRGAAYMKGRPFTKTTKERITEGEGKKFVVDGLKLGLERQGLDVKK